MAEGQDGCLPPAETAGPPPGSAGTRLSPRAGRRLWEASFGTDRRKRGQDSDEASAIRRGRRDARGGLEGCKEEKARGCLGAPAAGRADGWAPAAETTSRIGSRRQESASGTVPLWAVPGRTGHLPPASPLLCEARLPAAMTHPPWRRAAIRCRKHRFPCIAGGGRRVRRVIQTQSTQRDTKPS